MPVQYKNVSPIDNIETIINTIKNGVFPNASAIEVVFCNNAYIQEINKQVLNHDYPTDIITFYYDQEKPELDAELLISIEEISANAKTYNTSIDTELKRVIIHGCLHLLGYDDKTDSEKKVMREKENEYLHKLFHVEQN